MKELLGHGSIQITVDTYDHLIPDDARSATGLSGPPDRVTATAFAAIWSEGVPDMAALDWSQCEAVESISGKVSGAWAAA